MKTRFENRMIWAAFSVCLILLVFVFLQSRGLEGGQDSWKHYLISRFALKYPELLLDQWNKPVFTWATVLVTQGGIRALVVFNMLCVLFSSLMLALSVRKHGFEGSWVLIPFTVFTPVMFGNTISGLTEPLNVLFLSSVYFAWSSGYMRVSLALASMLPFVRTEGFVICGAIFLLLLLKKKYSLLPWLFLGSLVLNLAGWSITGKPFWIISENPYWRFEQDAAFDPGSGSLLHYVRQARAIFGLPMLLLSVYAHWIVFYRYWKNREKAPELLRLSMLVFWAYFAAHTLIYYWGILGSHGLNRVMAVLAPSLALMSFWGLHALLERLKPAVRSLMFPLAVLAVIQAGYAETDYAKPHRFNKPSVRYDKHNENFERAGIWLQNQGLMSRTIIHQCPYFDVRFGKDPYDVHSAYGIWSIDQKNDWAAPGVIVVWDGFYAIREGNMKLSWLENNPRYRKIHEMRSSERPTHDPGMFDIVIFEKTAP